MSSIHFLKHKAYSDFNEITGLSTFLNPYSYLFLRKNLCLFERFDRIYIDGILLLFLLRVIGVNVRRASFDMTSLAPVVIKDCIERNKTIYFIGSHEESITQFIDVIQSEFTQLSISGFRKGYFDNFEDRVNVIKSIIKLKPDVVVVGMGTPHQETFLLDLKEAGWSGTGFTCGGFIHQTAKGIDYYPTFYNKYNLRWLYRMIDEPKLIKRYLLLYPKSLILFSWDFFKYRSNKSYR